jgi:hypothetical protein
MASGLKVRARVVGYGEREITLQRRGGKLYVNDRVYENLPEIYRLMMPKIVGHFTKMNIETPENLEAWGISQRGKARRFKCHGVLMQLESGDHYAVPSFFFSDQDRQALEPGWERWLAAKEDSAQRDEESLMVESQAAAYQHDGEAAGQVSQLQLALLATASGVVDVFDAGPASRGTPDDGGRPGSRQPRGDQRRAREQPGLRGGPGAEAQLTHGRRHPGRPLIACALRAESPS